MAPPLAIAFTLSGFVFVLLLAADSLLDQTTRIRMLQTFDLVPDKERLSWGQRLRAALRDVRPPAFLDPWVQQKDLNWAGVSMDVGTYLALWWLIILLGIGLGLLIMATQGWRRGGVAFGLVVFLGALGSPYLYLHWRIRQRSHLITRSLPDFLDLLTFTVEAGLGFLPALGRVSQSYPGPLGEELRRVLVQIELGFSRAEALDEFVSRSPSPDVSNFVEAVKLSEQLGTSLARTLRVQANLLRLRRRQRAQAAAQTAPIRIIPALVFFFLPSLLLVYLAPPIINFLMRR